MGASNGRSRLVFLARVALSPAVPLFARRARTCFSFVGAQFIAPFLHKRKISKRLPPVIR
jgi:hypothetical protein